MEREEGYYWIQLHEGWDWQVAKYDSYDKEWLIEHEYFIDEEIFKIDERKIERKD